MESTEKKRNPRKEEETQQPVSLTDDLVTEILIRLPFRSLVRFQCVSKSWRSLTSDSRKKLPRRLHGLFHSTYFRPTIIKKHSICFVNMLEEAGDVDTALNFLPPSARLDDVDVCNGLLLCCLHNGSLTASSSRYVVFNPATRKYLMLPPYNVVFYQMCWLAFDPDVSIHYYVLSITSLGPTNRPHAYQVAIFSSKDRVWVVAEDRIELDSPICQSHCHVFFDGVLYMLAGTSIVLGFNLQGKVCRRLQLPDGAPKLDPSSYWGMCFGVYGGCLQIAGIVNDEMVMWELKGIEMNEWVLKHTTSVHAMEGKLPPLVFGLPNFILRSFHFDGDAILLTAGSALFCYDLSTTNMTEFCALKRESQHPFTRDVFYPYTPYYSEDLVFDAEDAELVFDSEDAETGTSSEVDTP